jgi:RNA polymerase sigma-70 factor (ECF subfamily)
MLRVKAGDRAALEEIFRLYRKPLLNYFHRLGADPSLAEDLLQESFLRLWRAARVYQASAKVSTYIFRIAHNLYLNQAARRRERPLEGPGAELPGTDPSRRETQEAVRRAVEQLPEGERECLVLSEYNGLKYAEISEILGIPEGTVKSRMFSALRRIREALKDYRA